MATTGPLTQKHVPRSALQALAPAFAVALLTWFLVGSALTTSMPKNAADSERAVLVTKEGQLSSDALLGMWLDDYRADRAAFDANLQLQCAAILAGLLLILRRSDTLQFLGNEVPLRWLHLALPGGLLYLWLHCGFLLDDLIEKRIMVALWSNETADAADVTVRALFWDSGFIDGWLVNFVDGDGRNYSGIKSGAPQRSSIFFMALIGFLVSASHAVLLGVTIVGVRRYVHVANRVRNALYWGAPAILFAFVAYSHLLFVYGGENRNTVQLVVAVATPFLLLGLLWLSVKVDQAGGHAHSLLPTIPVEGAATFRPSASPESGTGAQVRDRPRESS